LNPLAEPTLGPVQTLEVYDPLVAKIEAVLEHRRMLVAVRTLILHHIQDQLSKLPVKIRGQLATTGQIESRRRQLQQIDTTIVSTLAGEYRLGWLLPVVAHDREMRRQVRQLEREIDRLLDEHGTTLRDEPGIGTIAAATLLAEVGDPYRFARESKFARWCGTGAVALSSGEGDGRPVKHRLDFGGNRRVNSVLSTSPASPNNATTTTPAATSPANSPRARPAEKPAAPTNATSPTEPSDACGATNHDDGNGPHDRGLTREPRTVPPGASPSDNAKLHAVRRWISLLDQKNGV
jgi:hypothetical protein